MKNRIVSLFLTVMMVISLTSCGMPLSDSSNGEPSATEALAPADSNDTENEENPAQEGNESETIPDTENSTALESTPLLPVICKKFYNEYDSEIERTLFSGRTSGIILADECRDSYPALYDTLSKDWKKEVKSSNKSAKKMARESKSWYDESLSYGNDMDYVRPYADETDVGAKRIDEKVFSYSASNYMDMGGAHGMYGCFGRTYDTQTGKQLSLSDIISDLDAFGKKLYEEVNTDYPFLFEEMIDKDNLQTQIIEEVNNDPSTWALDPDGIVYFFNPYDIASYAAGQQIVKVYYQKNPELFNDAYLPSDDIACIVASPNGGDFQLDLDGDGKTEHVSLEMNYPPYEEGVDYEANGINIVFDDDVRIPVVEDTEVLELEGYCVKTEDNRSYIMAVGYGYNDIRSMYICELEKDDARLVNTYSPIYNEAISYHSKKSISKEYTPSDPSKLRLSYRFDRLSTYQAGGNYTFTNEGDILPQDEFAYVSDFDDNPFILKSKVSLSCDIVDEDGKVTSEAVSLPAGTEYTIYRTVNDSPQNDSYFVDCTLSDGRIARLYCTRNEDGQNTVDGIVEWEAFETLYYAG